MKKQDKAQALSRLIGVTTTVVRPMRKIPLEVGRLTTIKDARTDGIDVVCRYEQLTFGMADHVHSLTWRYFREHFEVAASTTGRVLLA